ncbi:hypothetical protein [Paraburkholderia antibiotica]|uniref:Uncharacterized protein n=1 Tax=Paraburkholderia antibiotica TaxID=2728839 RepID=A0A7X9X4L6_9BURK|nr:hypothetical protein [Paraburkholderia antibiotica]NML31349.1 hypothetical protein [Paraburkholderia antibiotica]
MPTLDVTVARRARNRIGHVVQAARERSGDTRTRRTAKRSHAAQPAGKRSACPVQRHAVRAALIPVSRLLPVLRNERRGAGSNGYVLVAQSFVLFAFRVLSDPGRHRFARRSVTPTLKM